MLVTVGFCQMDLMSLGGGGYQNKYDLLETAACRGNCGVLSSLSGDKDITLSQLRNVLQIIQTRPRHDQFSHCRYSDKVISMLQREIARRERS